MALAPYYLGDTSALARRNRAEVGDRMDPLLEAGLVARCTLTDLEAGFASTSPSLHRTMGRMRSAWPFVAMDQSVLDRAVEVQDALAERSQQRGVKIADLLIAAARIADFSSPPPRRPPVSQSSTTTTTSTSSLTSLARPQNGYSPPAPWTDPSGLCN